MNVVKLLEKAVKGSVKTQSNTILVVYDILKNIPKGPVILSKIVSHTAPYFRTVNPIILNLEVGYCEAIMHKSKKVENHIGTVHVIAICNGLEYVMGAAVEASVPSHLRWIPKGMNVDYVAKGDSDIRLVASINEDWKIGDMKVNIEAFREDGKPVVQGYITIWLTEKT